MKEIEENEISVEKVFPIFHLLRNLTENISRFESFRKFVLQFFISYI